MGTLLKSSFLELVIWLNGGINLPYGSKLAENYLFKGLSVSRQPPAKREWIQGTFQEDQIDENLLNDNDGLVFLTWLAIQFQVIGNCRKNSRDGREDNKDEQYITKFVLEGEDLVNFCRARADICVPSSMKIERFFGHVLKSEA